MVCYFIFVERSFAKQLRLGGKMGLIQEEIGISINKEIHALGPRALSEILYALC